MEYQTEEWEDIQLMDDEGNIVSTREIMSEEEFEALKQEILESEQNKEESQIEPYDEEKLTKYFLEIHNNEIQSLKINLQLSLKML